MTGKKDEAERREAAALWYTELQAPDISPGTWEAFLKWEKDPANAGAYREIEAALGILDRTSFSQAGPNPAGDMAAIRGRGARRLLPGLAAAAAVLILCATVLTLQSPEPQPAPLAYATAIGEQKAVTLEDGSIITLNTDTRLTVSYSKAERLIRLAQGEALFEVEHSERPFLVEAGGTATRALGTEFDIHAKADSVSITLIRGAVRVTASGGPGAEAGAGLPAASPGADIDLLPGDRVVIAAGKAPVRTRIDPAWAGKWREGLLAFDNVTLEEAIAEMNRYSTTKLRIEDETLAAERISGTFPAGKQEAFAESLQLYLPVRVIQTGHDILVVPQASDSP